MSKLLPVIALALAGVFTSHAQMQTGAQMQHYAEVFDLKINQRAYPYEVTLIDSQPVGNILTPGEQPAFSFLVNNNLDEPITVTGKFSVIAYGTRGIPGDIWLPEVYKIGDLPDLPVSVDLPAKGAQIVTVSPALPATLGAYALVLDLGPHGRRFATTCVRTFAASPEKIQYPKLSLDDIGVEVIHRLGVQAIRMGVDFVPTTHKDYAQRMARLDAELQRYAAHNITVLLMFGAGPTEQPLGRGRPHLTADGVMRRTKEDLVWMPRDDADFQRFVAGLCQKHGWPNGPVTAVSLWNEPWEGISISGWGADMPRYREIFTAMAQGVEEARAGGAQVLIGGCDSSGNTNDKLFGDGKDDFLKWLDVCTIHYQGMTAPVLYRQWLNRLGPNGRVKIWDTESWVANTDDRVAAVIAANRAAGYDRAMGIFGGNIASPVRREVKLPDGGRRRVETYHAWPAAAAVGAAQHFIGEREFRELLFKNGLPWVMVFDGAGGAADDGTIVIVGDLKEAFGNTMHFRNVRGLAELKHKEALAAQLAALPAGAPERAPLLKQLAAPEVLSNATLTLDNPDREFIAYDYSGNPLPVSDTITVPLNHTGNFLRTNGAAGSFARLVVAVVAATVSGYEPLNVVARDLTAPVASKPALRLTLTNILNRPVSGALTVSLGQLTLDAPARLDFNAHETREISIPVTGGAAVPNNTYPLAFKFDAGADGYSTLAENLRVNFVSKRTVSVDGNLDDWQDALPQPVAADGDQGPNLMEAAWLPFAKFDLSQQAGVATAYLAHDDQYFYFAAKIADNTPDPGTVRYETRDDDAYYYPPVAYQYDADKTLLKTELTWNNPWRDEAALFLPGSKTERSHTAWNSVAGRFAVDLDLPADHATLVTFYLLDWDNHDRGRRATKIEVFPAGAAAGDKPLAAAVVKEYGFGNYLTFRLAGKLRVIFSNAHGGRDWRSATLSAIFFDPDAEPLTGPAAQLTATDLTTGANWPGQYGRDGHHIFGSAANYPAYAKVTTPEVDVKKEYHWPEGVRRYSYRKQPDLPFGSTPKFDNVQIAFNVIPSDEKLDMVLFPPGTMPNFIPRTDTDYEYALNKVADAHGGGVEIWRSYYPGMPRKTFYPRQGASPHDGPVKNGKLVINYDGNTRIVEAAIPWEEIPLVKQARDAGRPIKFTYRVNDNAGPAMELATDRSAAKHNSYTLHPEWITHWSNELEFAFEK
ncbi:MAG: hypothetical protein LBK60_12755 [Verrucomicrobiales bacterium]|jgi:hypothetical protein|nr:hypothetical protein [Verrucomicrobiales bacterium]